MQRQPTVGGYVLAALAGALVGGALVAIAGRILPKLLEGMMAEFPRRMMERMRAEGLDPMEMCQQMMAEFKTEEPKV